MSDQPDQRIRVLHVDDDADVGAVTASFLEKEDDRFDVETVKDPQQVLQARDFDALDCIVSDYQMPGMDGIEFLEAVRNRHGDVPFILFTGKGSEEVASDAISAGASDYLRKQSDPSQYELLANRIVRAVDSRRAKRRATTLESVRQLVATVNQSLVRADSREAIETAVCECFAESGRYAGAAVVTVGDEISVSQKAGIDLPAESSECALPPAAESALEDGEVVFVDDFEPADDKFGAIHHDGETVNSVAIVSLTYNGADYGRLTVFATDSGVFDGTDREVFSELASDIPHAIDAVETRRAHRRERDRRDALFENAPNSMAEFTFDDGQPVINDVNDAFEETFGHARETVVGNSVEEFIVGEDHYESFESIVERALDGEYITQEVERETVSGTRQFLLTVAPFTLENVTGAYAWHIDITERKQLAAELQKKANLLDQLFEQLPVSLYVKDIDGRHRYMSDYDVAPGEVIGKTDLDIYGDKEFAREAYEDDMAVIETGEPVINREEYNEENGEWMLTSKVPWYGEDGEIKGLFGVTRFITEKKEYEREIERKNDRLEKFASVISHDLRNPLNVAAGHVDLLAQEYDDSRLNRVETALDRMDALIDDILDLARHGRAAFEPEPVSLKSVTEHAWANVTTKEVTLTIDETLHFCGDEARVLELLENLLNNACEHADPETITVGSLSEETGFYVADDGPGVPIDQREDVFRPGFTTQQDGTGFGLSIVEEIAQGHDWEIEVTESEAGGARFEITGVERCED